ncbi:MAG TPA: M28 family peptidase [Chthoniobacterales bacterium]
MRFITSAAHKRLAVLASLLLAALGFVCWYVMIRMPLKSYRGPLLPLTAEEAALRDALRRDVQALAGDIGNRNWWAYARLVEAADWIESSLTQAGYQVRRRGYDLRGRNCDNLEVEIRGRTKPDEIVIIGAHYDSVFGCPAANDNGSGVAALLALARAFADAKPTRTLRFVTFVNEEAPFYHTAQMGSLVYARECRQRGENVVAMLSLETIGYYSEERGSQGYPAGVGLFYPSAGNFVAFVGNTGSRALVRQCIGTFRREAKFPSEGAALPSWMMGIGWSDHWSFWQAGYPAIMVTDTAIFRYPHYHAPSDTPDKLDYDRLARVVAGLERVVHDLME